MTGFRAIALALCLLAGPAAAQTLVVISDLNGQYGSVGHHPRVAAAVQTIIGIEPDAVISTGDMIAGQKKPLLDDPQLDRMWTAFNQAVTDPLADAGIPLAVTPGNHDGSAYPEFERERERFEVQWRDRTQALDILPGSQWPRRYAARVGGLLLVAFDGTLTGKLPVGELEFLETMMTKHARDEEPIVAFAHLPMWPLASGREKEILDDRRLLDLLHRHGVDVYLSGHHHLFHAGRDDAGMLHVAVGALGGNVRPFSGGAGRQRHSFVVLELEGTTPAVRALSAPDFSRPIETATLPKRIDGPLGSLDRL